jgi:hypothetical protein
MSMAASTEETATGLRFGVAVCACCPAMRKEGGRLCRWQVERVLQRKDVQLELLVCACQRHVTCNHAGAVADAAGPWLWVRM